MATVFEQLDREWTRLSRNRTAAAQLRDVCEAAGGAPDLAGIERYVRAASSADADRVLLALVTRAAEDGCHLSARVLLQLLLPGTRRLARRWWALGDPQERAAAAAMAVYHRIKTYPVAARPGRVAANVLMDAAQELRRAVPRVPLVAVADVNAHGTPVPGPRHAADELAEILRDAVAAGVVDADDAEIIARSRIGGDRVADLAARRGLRPRTVWDRRQRAERALAAARLHDGVPLSAS
ncbi:MAG TPA: hypothetical protein VFI47_03415 [Acidimicrobiales bacterium]|nr:hypothetical protein [Acidimicrobiales bacterium]